MAGTQGGVKLAELVVARKDHYCSLCGEVIPAKTKYAYKRITPWDHADNETFFTYKAHELCDEVWQKIGDRYAWLFPYGCESEWKKDMAEYLESVKE